MMPPRHPIHIPSVANRCAFPAQAYEYLLPVLWQSVPLLDQHIGED